MNDPRSADLAEYCQALSEQLRAELTEWEPAPDLPAVVARAHEIAPRHVPETWVAEARELLTVPAPPRPWQSPNRAATHWEELTPFSEELREHLDRELYPPIAPLPELPAPRVPPSSVWTPRSVTYVSVAAAACLLLAFFSGRVVDRIERAIGSTPLHVAQHDADIGLDAHEARVKRARRSEPARIPAVARDRPEPGLEDAGELSKPVPPTASADPPTPSLKQRLRTLDAEARELWSAGHLTPAERKFRSLINIGKRRPEVELAYGDLFALLRQSSREAELVKSWGRYLRTFPRGRFAEDARAGLCHRAARSEAESCWEAYLEDHPRGAHRQEARLHTHD